MVVNEGITPKAELTQAFNSVQACPIVLALLNRSTHSVERQQYGYGND